MKNLDSNISLAMLKYASELYQNDDDKIITQDELKLFVDSKEDELTSKFGDKFEAMELISTLLKSNFNAEVVENAPETKEEASVEETKTSATEETKAEEVKTEEKQKSVIELQEQIDKYNEDIKNYTSQKETLITRNEEIEEQLDKEQQKYTALEEELASKNDEYEKIIKKINQATKKLEEDEQYQQKQVAYEAMSKFDPEKDGSWDNFLENYIKTNLPTSKYKGQLQGLITSSDFLSADLKTLGTKLSSQAKVITNLNDEYEQNVATINDCDTKIKEAEDGLNSIKQYECSSENYIDDYIKKYHLSDEMLKALEKRYGCDYKTVIERFAKAACAQEEFNYKYCNDPAFKSWYDSVNAPIYTPAGKSGIAPTYDINAEWAKASEGAFATMGADGQMHVYQKSKDNQMAYQAAVRTSMKDGYDLVGAGSGFISCGEGGKEQKCYDKKGNCCGTIKVSSFSSPLSLDINGDGVKTSDKVIDYDIDGDGVVDKINDSADAVLVFDKDGDGISGEDGSECFGDNTDLDGDGVKDGYKDGFEALKAMAKKEGLINGKDDNKLDENDLKILEDKYGLKIKTGGYNSKAESLADVGITEINLAETDKTTTLDNFDGNGNQLMKQNGATFKINGETHEYADIWHKKLDEENTKEHKNNKETKEEAIINPSFEANANILNDKIKSNQRKADNEIEEAQKAIKKSTSYKLDKDIEEVFNKKMMELQEQAQKALNEAQKEDEENKKDKKNNPFK